MLHSPQKIGPSKLTFSAINTMLNFMQKRHMYGFGKVPGIKALERLMIEA